VECGLPGNQYVVGLMCEKGWGVKKDEHAAQGHEEAKKRLRELGY